MGTRNTVTRNVCTLVAALGFAAGCDAHSSTAPAVVAPAIAGTYTLRSADGVPVPTMIGSNLDTSYTLVAGSVTLNNDSAHSWSGELTLSALAGATAVPVSSGGSGSYGFAGDSIVLTDVSNQPPQPIPGRVHEDTLWLSIDITGNGHAIEFMFTKDAGATQRRANLPLRRLQPGHLRRASLTQ